MDDYIKRKDAIRALAEYEAYDVTCETGIETTADDCVGTSAMVFEKIPSADVAPVVRCKDCKHRYITGSTTHYYVCDFMDAEYNDNGYCHHAERKDND